jgi:hypothetical protein
MSFNTISFPYNELITAYDYYRAKFFELPTRTKQIEAEVAVSKIDHFIEVGGQIWDRKTWGLSPYESLAAIAGVVEGKLHWMRYYIKNKTYKNLV